MSCSSNETPVLTTQDVAQAKPKVWRKGSERIAKIRIRQRDPDTGKFIPIAFNTDTEEATLYNCDDLTTPILGPDPVTTTTTANYIEFSYTVNTATLPAGRYLIDFSYVRDSLETIIVEFYFNVVERGCVNF